MLGKKNTYRSNDGEKKLGYLLKSVNRIFLDYFTKALQRRHLVCWVVLPTFLKYRVEHLE